MKNMDSFVKSRISVVLVARDIYEVVCSPSTGCNSTWSRINSLNSTQQSTKRGL